LLLDEKGSMEVEDLMLEEEEEAERNTEAHRYLW
jgi:hypothetical protein